MLRSVIKSDVIKAICIFIIVPIIFIIIGLNLKPSSPEDKIIHLRNKIEDYKKEINSNDKHMTRFLNVSKDAGSISLEFKEHNAKQRKLYERIKNAEMLIEDLNSK